MVPQMNSASSVQNSVLEDVRSLCSQSSQRFDSTQLEEARPSPRNPTPHPFPHYSLPFHSVLFTDSLSGTSTGKRYPSGLHGVCWKPLALPLLSALPCMVPLGAKGKIFSMIHKSLCIWSLPASQLSSPPSPYCSHMGPLNCS